MIHQHFSPLCCVGEFSEIWRTQVLQTFLTNLKLESKHEKKNN